MSCSAYRFGRRPVRDRGAHGEQIAPMVTGETVTGSKGSCTMTNTCMVPETCTTDCLFTCKPCTRYGFAFTSPLRIDVWFGADRRRKTLWRAQAGAWVEVASSTSARILADAFTSGSHVVMPARVAPRFPAPMAAIAGALF